MLAGGFGSALLECLSDLDLATPVVRIGWPDAFIEHGRVDALRTRYGLTAEAAMAKADAHVRVLLQEHAHRSVAAR